MSKNLPTILVVDPDERSYITFESVLGERNRVLFVPNGKTAINLPDAQNIDIIFVSHPLNGNDGIMLLESFKKRFPSLPVVLIAEQPKVDEVITAFRLGARELLEKPIDEKELVAVTNKIFRFVSHKKSKRWWFVPAKKETKTNTSEKTNNGHLKKLFHKSKRTENLSVTQFDDFQLKETKLHAEHFNYQLSFYAPSDTLQQDKETHSFPQKEATHPIIEAFFFGPFQVFVNHQPIEDWPGKKGKSIFAYLLFNHKKKIFRDVLMDLFWHKSSTDSARNCLNVCIHGIRRALHDIDPKIEYILFKDECYYCIPEIDIGIDVEEFRKTWRSAQCLEHAKGLSAAISKFEWAAGLYKGDFLEDEIYDSWSAIDRDNLKEIYLVILDKISEFYVLSKKHSEAIGLCEKILEKDNCREDIHRRLMLSYYRNGQRDKAIKQFQKCVEVLKEELEVKPSSETTNLFEQLKRDSLITKN
jgi:DNA-binding SARP family transcriptional activator/CheY-like chemotaxis protein